MDKANFADKYTDDWFAPVNAAAVEHGYVSEQAVQLKKAQYKGFFGLTRQFISKSIDQYPEISADTINLPHPIREHEGN